MKKPELNEGEIYIVAILNANGEGHHTILLPEHHDEDILCWRR